MSINSIVPLTANRWEIARQAAETTIVARIQKPNWELFQNGKSERPLWVTVVMVLMLLVVVAAAFVYSGSKEAVVGYVNASALVAAFPILKENLVAASIVAMLAMSEVAAIMFGIVGSVYARGFRRKAAFIAFQGAFVLVALIANITVTAEVPTGQPVIDWLMTLIAPVAIVGISLVIETMVGEYLDARKAALDAFAVATKVYQEQSKQPNRHPDFHAIWGQCILQQLIEQSKHNREVIPALIEVDPRVRQVIVFNEFKRHNWTFDPEQAPPELPATVGVSEFPNTKSDAKKVSPEKQKVLDNFAEHPENQTRNHRLVAIELGVSPSLVYRVQQELKAPETDRNAANT